MKHISIELPLAAKAAADGTDAARIESLTLPPWPTPSLWTEINQTLSIHLRIYHDHLIRARGYALLIRKELERIYPFLDQLCTKTCFKCEDICCCHSKPWYDFKDLIYLHLCEIELPKAQPIRKVSDSCRYLSASGCELKRARRPWICIWYLCPDQKKLLNTDFKSQHETINARLVQIKTHRNLLEKEFIRIVSEGIWPSWDGI